MHLKRKQKRNEIENENEAKQFTNFEFSNFPSFELEIFELGVGIVWLVAWHPAWAVLASRGTLCGFVHRLRGLSAVCVGCPWGCPRGGTHSHRGPMHLARKRHTANLTLAP